MTILPLILLIYSKCAEFRNSNLTFLKNKKIRNFFCKKTRTNSEQIGEESFQKRHCFIG
jgi:hypothetical protein